MNKKRLIIFTAICISFSLINALMIISAEFSNKENDVVVDNIASVNKYILAEDTENQIYDIVLEIEGENRAENPPTDVILVVDHSNSMSGEKIEKTKTAVSMLGEKLLEKTDNLSIGYVGFNDEVVESLVLQPTKDINVFNTFIQSATDINGGSHLHSGIHRARMILANQSDDHQKVIIILSDGVTTYSYKPISIDQITDQEVKQYGDEIPEYKVTGYDYGTRIGEGSQYGLMTDAFRIGKNIIKNTGDPTIGELLSFKQKDNHYVYTVGVELSDSYPTDPDAYKKQITKSFGSYVDGNGETQKRYTLTTDAVWDETVKDRLYTPGEKIKVEGIFTNDVLDASTGLPANVIFSLVPNISIPLPTQTLVANAKDYFVDTGSEVIAKVFLDNNIVHEFTFQELFDFANDVSGSSKVTVLPNSTYKMTIELTVDDYKLMETEDAIKNLHVAVFSARAEIGNNSVGFFMHAFTGDFATGPVLGFHSPYLTKQQGEYVLRNLSTDGISGSTYFEVSDIDNLSTTLVNDVYTNITDSIVEGVVTDPMSDYVTYIGLVDIRATNQDENDLSLLTGVESVYTDKDKTLRITGLNLSEKERVFVTYKVRLNKDMENFEFNHWYDTNNTTTLLPRVGETVVNFPIPQVKIIQNNVTLRYSANAGNDKTVKNVSTEISEHEVGSITKISSSIPTRDKYMFVHWEVRSADTLKQLGYYINPEEDLIMNENIVLYAIWKKKTVIVEEIPDTRVIDQTLILVGILCIGVMALVVSKNKEFNH